MKSSFVLTLEKYLVFSLLVVAWIVVIVLAVHTIQEYAHQPVYVEAFA